MTLAKAHSIHFIGISGIGISAIAKWALENQKKVSGSDLTEQKVSARLVENGAKVFFGEHRKENLPKTCDLVVYNNAIGLENPELVEAKAKHLKCISYPQAIGELMEKKSGIAIAGTHGKSTTTGMLAYMLLAAQHDPSVIVGTRLPIFDDSNERFGQGEDFLVEADEYKKAFLAYRPKNAAVLNVELDHLDVYKDEFAVLEAFKEFASQIPSDGNLILNAEDKYFQNLKKSSKANIFSFGLNQADIFSLNIVSNSLGTTFQVKGLYQGEVKTQIYGQHNVMNALAALALAKALGLDFESAKQGLKEFPGAWRRFERKGEWQGAIVIDDYAHHPTELKATLETARNIFPGQRLICIFQPHQKIRVKTFFNEFVQVLKLADITVLPEIYQVAGRESDLQISSLDLVESIAKDSYFVEDVQTSVALAQKLVKKGDIILTVGAGDITKFYELAKK
ncbi:UDP-N-acetylmuramate--L-alanine ligase [Candidatus Parcubacteria bacterium]|jgi:UDP-N-acetylmuramate--alanine ligase|nr:MAG: UDP-N-acetylmuramate--L-alanine ligase [Candidatus Parcubacteria bacterium]